MQLYADKKLPIIRAFLPISPMHDFHENVSDKSPPNITSKLEIKSCRNAPAPLHHIPLALADNTHTSQSQPFAFELSKF